MWRNATRSLLQATKASPRQPAEESLWPIFTSPGTVIAGGVSIHRTGGSPEEIIVVPAPDADAQAFISQQDHFFLTTVDADGFPTVSYKGGNSGFVQIVDETTLLFPCFDGNGMWLSMGNIADHPKIGMLFINTVEPHRIRIQGNARLIRDPDVLARWKDVGLAVEVSLTRT